MSILMMLSFPIAFLVHDMEEIHRHTLRKDALPLGKAGPVTIW